MFKEAAIMLFSLLALEWVIVAIHFAVQKKKENDNADD